MTNTIVMKTIKAIISVVLFAVGMAAQAQQAITVKTSNDKEKFLLDRRVVLDMTKATPIVKNKNQQTIYRKGETIVMYVSTPDDSDVLEATKTDDSSKGAVYDLSGRKIVNGNSLNGRLPKGIYIKDGKKIVQN